VLVPFPFSDLTGSKLRPAVVLADADRGDWIMCQVTSRTYGDTRAIALAATDFESGGLRVASTVRPAKLFTAHDALIVGTVGQLTSPAIQRVIAGVIALLGGTPAPSSS
jgi:mRNA interferase MazF